jgi:CheY-like chemotaxis protein
MLFAVSSDPVGTPVVLVVDADEDTRRLYRVALSGEGYAVEDAADGREALAKAARTRPAVLVTETRLPFIDGYELCEILRKDPHTHNIGIVIVTGEARPLQLQRAKTSGADAVLVKPVFPDVMVDQIHQAARRGPGGARVSGDPAFSSEAMPPTTRLRPMVRAHLRYKTAQPPAPPPQLWCPVCDSRLSYERSHVGGVNARLSEQWDYLVCPNQCGTFQYRHRTRKLRSVV